MILDTIYRSYLFGKFLRQIAKDLNKRFGYTKRGCSLNYKSVRYILGNTAYNGVLSGTLEGTEHYYRENSNIEPLVDPVIFALVQKKLEVETTGRKRTGINHSPVLMLCRYCGHYLRKNHGTIVCEQCRTKEDAKVVMLTIEREMEQYTNHKFCSYEKEGIRKRLILQYQIKSWKLESKLKDLLLRKRRIRAIELDSKSKIEMMKVNSKLIMELLRENDIVKGILIFLQTFNDEELKRESSYRVTKNLFIKLPFITLIDLVDRKIELLFLINILKRGDSEWTLE